MQLCAALAARAAVPDRINTPEEFQCPIMRSGQPMADPVMLVETGHTYERGNILRWLASKNTCPVTNLPLVKEPSLTPNHTLKRSIHSWAAAHGVTVPATPVHHSTLLQAESSSSSSRATSAFGSRRGTSTGLLGATGTTPLATSLMPRDQRSGGRLGLQFRKGLTKWAIIALVVVSVVLVVSVSVGVAMYFQKKKPGEALSSSVPLPSLGTAPPPPPLPPPPPPPNQPPPPPPPDQETFNLLGQGRNVSLNSSCALVCSPIQLFAFTIY
jgi:hypothetical protein